MAHDVSEANNGTCPDLRLTSREMARFVRDGFLRFDDLVPRDLCAAAMAEIESGSHMRDRGQAGAPFRDVWAEPDSALGTGVPAAAGGGDHPQPGWARPALRPSRRAPDARAHPEGRQSAPGCGVRTCGATISTSRSRSSRNIRRRVGRHAVPAGQPVPAGVRVHHAPLPGCARQVQAICDAGTMFFWHTNVWHAAAQQPHRPRPLHVQAAPHPHRAPAAAVEHRRSGTPGNAVRHRQDPQRHHPWHGQRHRIEVMNRIRLWRYLTGDPDFDVAFWWDPHREHPGDHLPHPARLKGSP